MTNNTNTMNTINDTSTGNQPVEKMHFGGIHLSIWLNTTEEGETFYSTRIERRYKAADGSWKSTNAFSKAGLPVAADMLTKAYLRIAELEAEAHDQSHDEAKADSQTGEIAA